MPHRLGLRTAVCLPRSYYSLRSAVTRTSSRAPRPRSRRPTSSSTCPAVPAFDLPPAPADGSHTVKELRVKGKKLLETDVTVKGFVTWAYDCKTAIRKPDEDDKALQARIDEDPTLCERPKFYIGDTADTPAEKSLWVVDVPRPYNTLEMKRIKKKDRIEPDRCEPDEKDPKKSVCPPYAVGDEVEITGTFKTSSPHSERNSDGLARLQEDEEHHPELGVAAARRAAARARRGARHAAGGRASPRRKILVKKK